MNYVEVLEEHLLPFINTFPPSQPVIYQQDNASIHSSKLTSTYLWRSCISTLDWPACSPDLNPIENIWGHLVRAIYAGNKQYQTVAELKQAILSAWDDLTIQTLQNHVNSMPNRIFEVIQRDGKATSY